MVSIRGLIGVIKVTNEYFRTAMMGFCVANAMKISNEKLVEDFGLFPMVVPLEKIVEFHRVHLLGSFQNHVGYFDQQGNGHWLMNQ